MELYADVLHLQVSGEVTQLDASAMLYRIAELCAGRRYFLLLQLRQAGRTCNPTSPGSRTMACATLCCRRDLSD